MKIAIENGYIQILSLQFPGKKKMTASELLNGMSFSEAAKVQ
jgi:methionyl-tRNA formyltransferase